MAGLLFEEVRKLRFGEAGMVGHLRQRQRVVQVLDQVGKGRLQAVKAAAAQAGRKGRVVVEQFCQQVMHQLGGIHQPRQHKAAQKAGVTLAEERVDRPSAGRIDRQLVQRLRRQGGVVVTLQPQEMHPVDRPGVVFGGGVDMRRVGWDDQRLACRQGRAQLPDLIPAGPGGAVDQDVLRRALRPLAIVIAGVRIPADVRRRQRMQQRMG